MVGTDTPAHFLLRRDHDYDTPEGVRLAMKAVRLGDASARDNIARRLSWIIGGELPYRESEVDELIGIAEAGWNAILGDPDCRPEDMYQFAIDILWDDDGGLISENAGDGAAWLLRAAESDHPDAQFEIGRLYYEGVGVKQSMELAAEWLERSSGVAHNADHAAFFLEEIRKKSRPPFSKRKKKPGKARAKAPAKPAAKAKARQKTKAAAGKKLPVRSAVSGSRRVAAKKPVAKVRPVVKKPAPKKKTPVKRAAARKR